MTSLPELHPQLARDCIELGRFSLCRLLLMNDSQYPWFILVPLRKDIREIHELFEADQQQLLRESNLVSRMLVNSFKADKINIAALGNVVPQLHVHHIARYENDPAWPAPVWGKHAAIPYEEDALQDLISKVQQALGTGFQALSASSPAIAR